MSEDSTHLAEQAARGDAGAMQTLLELHLDGLRAFVRLRTGPELRQRESSSDLVQSVCREILEQAHRFQHPSESAFRRWLYTTALRKISDRAEHWRAQKRDAGREQAFPSHGGEAGLLRRYGSFSSPSQHAMVREEVERVEKAFEELSEEQREVITLAHVAGLSRAEIAEQMGRSEGAVRVLLHRSLARLAEVLEAG
ncbi:MAG: sigma-70 family RNA polymerase sigma factor [Planctomycetota bacterium]|nr:sigma-70 family RNA polymerase sigma factor [Planctomycetota bacterium]